MVTLAEPRGFCAGVERAIEIVERALERFAKQRVVQFLRPVVGAKEKPQ